MYIYGKYVLREMSSKERRRKCTESYHEEWKAGIKRKVPSLWNNNVQNWSGLILLQL